MKKNLIALLTLVMMVMALVGCGTENAAQGKQDAATRTVTDIDGLTGNAVVIVPARSELRPRLNSTTVPARIPAGRTTEVSLSTYISSYCSLAVRTRS